MKTHLPGRRVLRLRCKLLMLRAISLFTITGTLAMASNEQVSSQSASTPATVRIGAFWTEREQESFLRVLDWFSANSEPQNVKLVDPPNDVREPFPASAESDTSRVFVTYQAYGDIEELKNAVRRDDVDVVMLPRPGLLRSFKDCGWAEPLPSEVVRQIMEQPGYREAGMVDNEPLGLWYKASLKSYLWYDSSRFHAPDLTPPESWDKLVALVPQISQHFNGAISLGVADNADRDDRWVATDWFENLYVRIAGAEKYRQLADGDAGPDLWGDKDMIDTLDKFKALFTQPRAMWPKDIEQAGRTDFPTSIDNVYKSHDAALVLSGDYPLNRLEIDERRTADFFDFPSVRGEQPVVVAGGDIAVMLNKKPATQSLMRFLASTGAARVWVDLGAFISPHPDIVAADYETNPLTGDLLLNRLVESWSESRQPVFDLSDRLDSNAANVLQTQLLLLLADRTPQEVANMLREHAQQPTPTGTGTC